MMPMDIDPNGIRNGWEFSHSITEILDGVSKQIAFREARIAFWRDIERETREVFKTGAGLTMTDTPDAFAMSVSNYHRGGPQIQIEPKLRDTFIQAMNKITEHTAARLEYINWQKVLKGAAKKGAARELEMTYPDWLYFFRDAEVSQEEAESSSNVEKNIAETKMSAGAGHMGGDFGGRG